MNKLVFSSLKTKLFINILFIVALVIILVFQPLAITSIISSHQQIKSDITHYSRGSYDLLVRPNGLKHPLEDELGIVPENYIGFGEGGISTDQWTEIKEMTDVEIAAPVASLGYFTGIRSNIGIESPEQSERVSIQFSTTDGVNHYPVGKRYECIFLESPKLINDFIDFETLVSNNELLNSCTEVAMFPLPQTYNLLVGIDPTEEQKLTGLLFDFGKSGWGSTVKTDLGLSKASVVPIIEIVSEGGSLEAELEIDSIEMRAEDTKKIREQFGLVNNPNDIGPTEFYEKLYSPEYQDLFSKLSAIPETNEKIIKIDLGSNLNNFHQEALMVLRDGTVNNMVPDGIYTGTIDLNSVTEYYVSGQLKYEKAGDTYKVKKINEVKGIPIYRNIEEKGFNLQEVSIDDSKKSNISFIPDPIGKVEVDKEKQQQLASSPLGIYQFAPVYYKDIKSEKLVKMKPTITPGSFVSVPAQGVTTIEAANVIKGREPIDAIRVRVGGIDHYTEEAASKIKKVAKEIEELDLQVTIIAGASPQKLEIEVEDVGLVQESWTTLGASGSIVGQWNLTNLILSAFFFIVTIIYILNRLFFWKIDRQKDISLFIQLGWSKQSIYKLFRTELFLLYFISFLVSYPVLLYLKIWMDFEWDLFLLHSFVGVILFVIFFVYIKVGLWVSGDSKGVKYRIIRRSRLLVIKNLFYLAKYIRLPFIQMILVSTLSTFVYLLINETVNITSVTLLGDFINVQANKWHYILVASSYVITGFALIETLISLINVREKEIRIYRTLGWKKLNVLKLFLSEVAIWSSISIALGVLLSLTLYGMLFSLTYKVLLISVFSFICFYVFVLLISYIVVMRFIGTKSASENVKVVSVVNDLITQKK